jgi:hypothetical protein
VIVAIFNEVIRHSLEELMKTTKDSVMKHDLQLGFETDLYPCADSLDSTSLYIHKFASHSSAYL